MSNSLKPRFKVGDLILPPPYCLNSVGIILEDFYDLGYPCYKILAGIQVYEIYDHDIKLKYDTKIYKY